MSLAAIDERLKKDVAAYHELQAKHRDDEYETEERAAIAEPAPVPVLPSWLTPADRARKLGKTGVRLPPSLPTLDKATRGGLRTKKVVVLGGAPGAGKTTLAVQQGLAWAMAGVHVAIAAADEEADGLLIRVGQNLGFHREDLEDGIPEAKELLAERLEELVPTLLLVDQDEENVALEAVSLELKRRAAGAPSVLIVDSIQTVRTIASVQADGPRARVDAVVAAMKHSAKADEHLVLATCELSRGAYRKADDRIEDMAAFKESGGIEYGVSLAMVLRSVPEGDGTVDVSMPKNRMGQKLPFRLALDHLRAKFSETTYAPPEDEDAYARFEALSAKVIALLSRDTTLATPTAIALRLGGRKQAALQAVKDLIERGRIGLVDGTYRVIKEPTL